MSVQNLSWIYDMGKFVYIIAPESTLQNFSDKLLKRVMPPKNATPVAAHLVVDKYIEDVLKVDQERSKDLKNQLNKTERNRIW